MPTSIIAIVGRPNVGKSTLFNRFVGYRKAIVDETPGVTRDRNTHLVSINGRLVYLIDTGGYEPVLQDNLKAQILEQTILAIEEADLILLVCDGQEGINPADEEVARILRTSGKKTLLVVNKIDDFMHEKLVDDFFSLGFPEIIGVSSEHKTGLDELKSRVNSLLPTEVEKQEDAAPRKKEIRVAVVGKPNTGKSSLINKILGENRIIVSETAGTTRDAIDTLIKANCRDYLFIDTAGIRKKTRVSQKLEKYSVIMALKNMERADIVILMIDAMEGIGTQDAKIAAHAYEMGRGCVIAINKWDLLEKETQTFRHFELSIKARLAFLEFAPVLSLSALTGQRLEKLFPAIDKVYENYCLRIPTAETTKIFEDAFRRQPPPLVKGKTVRMFFATQAAVCPPTFVCFVNNPEGILPSYLRYLENQVRQTHPFEGTPIRILFKKRERRE